MKGPLQTWRGFRRLSGDDRGVVVEAAAAMAAARIGLRVAGFRRWKALLERLTPETGSQKTPRMAARESARAITRLQQSAARHLIFQANCLEQSLALWWILRRRGIGAALHIGARKNEERFEAHAWVELEGAILNDAGGGHPDFAPFDAPVIPAETRTP